jgi:hypothetical protein
MSERASKMHSHEKYGMQIVEILQSFNTAVQQACGAILSAKSLREMSAEDLMLLFASNRIRFACEPEET